MRFGRLAIPGRARLQSGRKSRAQRALPLCRRPEWSPKGETTDFVLLQTTLKLHLWQSPQVTSTRGTFFVTAITANRRRLFQTETNANLFLDILQHYRTQGLYKLHAYVAMPDHVHLLLTTDNLPNAMKHIRGGFSRRLASKLDVWQRGYVDHHVVTREEFEIRRTYIHQNPSCPPHHPTQRVPLLLRFS